MRFLITIFCFSTVFLSCNEKGDKEVIIDKKLKAIGSTDPFYDGLIKFYDVNDNRLLYSCNYKKGILDGEKNDFYANGKLYSKQVYDNGKLNGYVSFYDSTESLFFQQYFYFGIKAGPEIQWQSGKAKNYEFYSFDNELLFTLNYDSLQSKRIVDIEDEYIFYHTKDFYYLNSLTPRKEYFIYIPQPPKFKFEYSVVKVDSAYNVLSIEQEIKNDEIWSSFSINDDKFSIFAIKLFIKDSINKVNYTMFKRINQNE